MLNKKEVNALLVAERKKGRAKITTKATIKALLVEERKKSNIAHRETRFKQRTLAIYSGQVRRAIELNMVVSYTLDEFRELVRRQLTEGCPYCRCKLTVNNFTDDHPWAISRGGPFTLENTVACCHPCNQQKGALNKAEFEWLTETLNANLPPEAVTDVRRRLTLGGKWAGRMFS